MPRRDSGGTHTLGHSKGNHPLLDELETLRVVNQLLAESSTSSSSSNGRNQVDLGDMKRDIIHIPDAVVDGSGPISHEVTKTEPQSTPAPSQKEFPLLFPHSAADTEFRGRGKRPISPAKQATVTSQDHHSMHTVKMWGGSSHPVPSKPNETERKGANCAQHCRPILLDMPEEMVKKEQLTGLEGRYHKLKEEYQSLQDRNRRLELTVELQKQQIDNLIKSQDACSRRIIPVSDETTREDERQARLACQKTMLAIADLLFRNCQDDAVRTSVSAKLDEYANYIGLD